MTATVTRPRGDYPALDTYFRDVGETELLSLVDEHDLAMRVQEGDAEARDELVRANLRLVVFLARKFNGRGLSLQDLIQEGNLGLMRAVEGFDPEMGTRFMTYARYWIIQSLQRALERSAPTIRIPNYAVDLAQRWRKTSLTLRDELGREPTEEEVSVKLGITDRQMRILKKALRIYNQPAFSASLGDDRAAESTVLAIDTSAPDAAMSQREEVQHVLQQLHKLEERDAQVLRMRFGLDSQEPMTLVDIGVKLGLTRERVRQIERDALRKLRDLVA